MAFACGKLFTSINLYFLCIRSWKQLYIHHFTQCYPFLDNLFVLVECYQSFIWNILTNKTLVRLECGAFSENSTSFPRTRYFLWILMTQHVLHVILQGEKKQFIQFFKKRYIELINSKITKFLFQSTTFHGIFRKGNPLNLG